MSYPSISASPHPSSPPLSPEHHGYVSSTQARSGSRESTPTSIHPAGQASSRSPTVASSAAAAAGSRSPGYPSPPASPPQRGDPKSGTMGPPQTVPRSSHAHRTSTSPSSPSSSGGSGAYSSMTGASVTLQQPATQTYAHLPPGRAATGGQSHSHRPVSAMPTPVDHSSSRSSQASGNVFASMQGTYAERRASAHPTMSSSSSSSSTPGGGSSAPPLPSSPHGMDAITNQAISSGIPITSPAALSYFAAHPRRQQVHFGNYLLLQTLGEGEFGKVKLGVHKEWGEEVAVKLIKREKVGTPGGQLQLNNPEKDPAKMSKVEREIQVLKDVRHPNIVRLYEVIESDRYIGIVLEYASGGELFDHILAHKYLKERDACRLFAQLISGVSYLHQKKIVHRDLKLENLLLDRNRNVIITDFGFANNFEDRRDDLMATSCGSPCYAAPELVVQDGLYAGSAVDVWSCGVILYAMLAGYLPFDDDPANPDGDNINLLYKYIMATPLSFPDYITAEPRDLLSRMLVPDPLRRADLQQVMSHSWLSAYRDLFKFSVEDLERAAVEQQTKKRQIYRQQMLYQQQIQEQHRQQQQVDRSQSVRNVVGMAAAQSTKSQRHQSAMATSTTVPDRIYEASPSIPSTSSAPSRRTEATVSPHAPQGHPALGVPLSGALAEGLDPVTAQGNARGEPRTRLDTSVSSSSSQTNASGRKRDSAGNTVESDHRRPAAQKTQRHTIQLEYSGDREAERSRKESSPTPAVKVAPAIPPLPKTQKENIAPAVAASPVMNGKKSTPQKPPPVAAAAAEVKPAPPALGGDVASAAAPTNVARPSPKASTETSAKSAVTRTVATVPSPILEQRSPTPQTPSNETPKAETATIDVRLPSSASTASALASSRGASNPLPGKAESVAFPAPGDRVASTGSASAVDARSRRGARPSTSQMPPSAKVERTNSRHRKGLSTDKFFFGRLLGSPSIANDSRSSEASQAAVANRADGSIKVRDEKDVNGPGRSSSRRKAMSLVVGRPAGQESPATRDREKASNGSKKEEFKEAAGRARKDGDVQASAGQVAGSATAASPSVRQSPSVSSSRPPTGSVRTQNRLFDESINGSSSTVGPSSSAAKKVMDWFRKKSLSRGGFNEQPPLPPFERVPAASSQARSSKHLGSVSSSNAPQVLVTSPAPSNQDDLASSSVPSSRSTSGTHSQASDATDLTRMTSATEVSRSSVNGVKSSASTVQQPTPKASATMVAPLPPPKSPAVVPTGQKASIAYHDSRLRFHLGAVDQSALTSRPPPDVLHKVRQALFEMGIDVRKEKDEDFKLECVRRKRAKTLIGATQGLGLSIKTSVFPPSQAELERSSRSSGVPLSPSPSTGPGTGGGSIRNFLRRGSQQQGSSGGSAPGSAILPSSATTSQFEVEQAGDGNQTQPPPLYGDASVDGGQEIRFSVEVTKIKNLPGLYSLDIRRMKGNLWAYKFIYHALLDRCQLGGGSVPQPSFQPPTPTLQATAV